MDKISTTRFHFDANQAWGYYPEQWEYIKSCYPTENLRSARADMRTLTPRTLRDGTLYFMPSFGFRIEHQGPMTLGEWMDLYDLPYDVPSE